MVKNDIDIEREKNERTVALQKQMEQEYYNSVNQAQEMCGSANEAHKKMKEYELRNYELIKENLQYKDMLADQKSINVNLSNKLETMTQERKTVSNDLQILFNKYCLALNQPHEGGIKDIYQTTYLLAEIMRFQEDNLFKLKEA